MISLVINDEKYLTLNLSKEPDVFFHISQKIFTTIIPPNFISKVATKITPLSVLQINIIPLPVTMNRKVKNTPVKLNFWLSQ